MKKISATMLSLLLLISLSSCNWAQRNVKNVTLTDGEQRIADLTSDITKKFSFPKDNCSIKIYLYRSGELEVIGHAGVADNWTVIVSGRQDGPVSFAWNILSGNSRVQYQAIEIDEDTPYIRVMDIGQKSFTMEADKEYALVYVAYKAGTELEASATEAFSHWDTIEDKAEALSDFSYAYVVTAQLSDS